MVVLSLSNSDLYCIMKYQNIDADIKAAPICEKYNVPYVIMPGIDYRKINGESVLKLAADIIERIKNSVLTKLSNQNKIIVDIDFK